jgi:hypothetical protein
VIVAWQDGEPLLLVRAWGAVGANVMLLFVIRMHDLLGMTLEEAVYHGDINYFRIIKGFHHLG